MTRGGPHAYGDTAYWDSRYSQDTGSFDWYQQYSDLQPLLQKYVPKASRILMAGCGNAVISEDMVNDGYQEIINIDISSVVIEAMQSKYHDFPQLKYLKMDARDLSFADNEFDSVIDKGLLDSLMCGANAHLSAAKMLEEVCRVLKPGGVYLLVTYGDPSVRMPHLKALDSTWTVNLHVLPKSGSKRALEKNSWEVTDQVPLGEDGSTLSIEDPDLHYVYVCVKRYDAAAVPQKGIKHGKGK